MRDGLKLVVTQRGYWPLVQVCWVRSVGGDEYELVGARVLRRIGDRVPLSELAAKGPGKTIRLQFAAEEPEETHRLLMGRCIPANVKNWIEHCPKPREWVDAK